MSMKLRSAGPSPFGRKVRIAAAALGLAGDITVENTDTMDEDDSIRRQNPLGKIPALILDDGRVLYDSRVIVEMKMRADGRRGPAGTWQGEQWLARRQRGTVA